MDAMDRLLKTMVDTDTNSFVMCPDCKSDTVIGEKEGPSNDTTWLMFCASGCGYVAVAKY